jgi:hypothetical protein
VNVRFGSPAGPRHSACRFSSPCSAVSGVAEEVLGEWEVPPHPEVSEARKSFQEVEGDFDDTLLDSSEFIRMGLQG